MDEFVVAIVDELLSTSSESSNDSSSSSSTSSENEDNYEFLMCIAGVYLYFVNLRGQLIPLPRIQNYLGVVNSYSPNLFKSHFRMLPDTFHHLVLMLQPELRDGAGRPMCPLDQQVLIVLWYIATPDSYRSVCEKFNIGKATAFRTIRRVVNAICKLAPKVIQWPQGAEVNTIWNGFRIKGPISKIIGVIDGCHIDIRKPSEDGDSFTNRHHRFSIQLQGVCDHRCRFTHVYVGNCGSLHDQRVLRLSEVNSFLNDPERYFPENSHLLGDSAYTIHKHLLVPYRDNGHLTAQQIYLNQQLSTVRSHIERTFGFLKNRFQSLLYCCPLTDTQFIPKYIMACCVIHNICQMRDDFIDIVNIGNNGEDSVVQQNVNQNNPHTVAGKDKRVQITKDIWPGEL